VRPDPSRRPRRPRRLGALAAVLAATVVAGVTASVPAAAAGPSVQLVDAPKVKVLRGDVPAGTKVLPRQTGRVRPHATREPLSSWTVQYDAGFDANPQARAAFQQAVDTWAGLITSPVPIVVNARFTDLGGHGVLGQAGPTDFAILDTDGNAKADTAFPISLANALAGRDLTPTRPDIDAEFSSTEPGVYYGTDGNPPAGQIDFTTVVLHELGHGLGLLGSLTVDTDGHGRWGTASPYPDVYDRFTVRSAGSVQGKALLSYPNGSTALAGALTSGAVYWDGPLGKAAYRGRPVRLYAPPAWEEASSYSHLSDVDFPAGDPDSLMTPFVQENEVIHDPGPVVLGMFGDMGWQTPAPVGLRYTPIDPVRLLDTRDGTGGTSGRLGRGKALDVGVLGGAVPTSATAVVLNVTGLGPSSPTDLRVYPTPRSGTARPLVSNLNLAAGDQRANLVTVLVGEGGKVRVFNAGGAPHVLVDIQGWYGPDGASGYQPTDPVRILDTRTGTGNVPVAPLPAGQPLDLMVVGGPRAVPATATAVVLTVTALRATTTTDVRVFGTPADAATPPPRVSNLNLRPGQVVPNLVVAKIGAGGAVRLLNSAGTVDLLADLAGWYDDAPGGSLFHPLAPERVLDTRVQPPQRLGAGGTRDVRVTQVAGVPASGATAVVANITGVDASAPTDVAAYPVPADGSVPTVSTLNLAAHQTAADLAVVGVGAGGLARLRNKAGAVALVVDLSGWFGP
jgi:hypothetical protein